MTGHVVWLGRSERMTTSLMRISRRMQVPKPRCRMVHAGRFWSCLAWDAEMQLLPKHTVIRTVEPSTNAFLESWCQHSAAKQSIPRTNERISSATPPPMHDLSAEAEPLHQHQSG